MQIERLHADPNIFYIHELYADIDVAKEINGIVSADGRQAKIHLDAYVKDAPDLLLDWLNKAFNFMDVRILGAKPGYVFLL